MSRAYLAVFVFVIAPIGAFVLISALLLFGVPARIVFAAGFALLRLIRSAGLHAPNAVGVLTTAFLAWSLIVTAGLLWDRRRR